MMAKESTQAEKAVRTEEQILNLFCGQETEIYRGCILKQADGRLIVYPLYCKSDEYTLERIEMCEEIGRQRKMDCEFHVIEQTNYYFASLLTDRGYQLQNCCLIGELSLEGKNTSQLLSELSRTLCSTRTRHRQQDICPSQSQPNLHKHSEIQVEIATDTGIIIGLKQRGLLFLPQDNLPSSVTLDDILEFSLQNEITRILVRIPGVSELPASYSKMGFRKNHLYHCYQRQPEQEILPESR